MLGSAISLGLMAMIVLTKSELGYEEELKELEDILNSLVLENEELRSKINDIETQFSEKQPIIKRQPTPNADVGFTAAVGVYNLTNIAPMQRVVFDRVISNIGNAYERATGKFRVPVDGLYVFSIDMSCDPHFEADLHLIRADLEYSFDVSYLYADGLYSNSFATSSRFVVLELAENDEIFLRNGITRPIELHGNGFTTFSGFLLRRNTPSS